MFNLKNICIIGSSGFLGNELSKILPSNKVNLIKPKVPRPTKNDNLEKFYQDYIKDFFVRYNKTDIILNFAGSTNPKNKIDFFFNENFDYFLQKYILNNSLKIKLISINSCKIFRPYNDKYSLSKKNAEKKYLEHEKFYVIYPDLILKENVGAYKTIYLILKKFNYLPLPTFKPGKIFNIIECQKFISFIESLIYSDFKFRKIVILGKIKKSLYEIIVGVKNKEKLNTFLLPIPSSFFNLLPKKLKKIFFRFYFFQSFDNASYDKYIDKKKYYVHKI